jgi:hypothetical protein
MLWLLAAAKTNSLQQGSRHAASCDKTGIVQSARMQMPEQFLHIQDCCQLQA